MKQYREDLRKVRTNRDKHDYYFHRWITPPDPLEGNVRGIVEDLKGICHIVDISNIRFIDEIVDVDEIDEKAEDKRKSDIKRMDDELSQDNKVQADFDEV